MIENLESKLEKITDIIFAAFFVLAILITWPLAYLKKKQIEAEKDQTKLPDYLDI